MGKNGQKKGKMIEKKGKWFKNEENCEKGVQMVKKGKMVAKKEEWSKREYKLSKKRENGRKMKGK